MKRLPVIVLGWAGAVFLACLYLRVGVVIDALIDGGSATGADYTVLAACAAAAALCAWAVPALGAREQARVEAGLRSDVVGHVIELGVAQRTRERTGRITSSATDGVERVAAYRATFLGPMIAAMTVPIVVLVVVGVSVDPVIAWLLAIAIPVIPLALGGFQSVFRKVSQQYRTNARQFSAQFLDAIQGLPTLRILGAGRTMGEHLARAAEDLRQHVMKLLAGNQLVLLIVDSLFSLAMITGAGGLAMWRLTNGEITAGQALAVVLMSTLLLEPLDRIGQFFYIGMGGMAAAREIRTFVAEPPLVSDRVGVAAPSADEHMRSQTIAPAIEFDAVSFAYDPATPLLRDVTFSVNPGEKVALIGPSGSGKTTVAELLQATIRPESGAVRIKGFDGVDVPRDWWREQISVVAQNAYLFTGTLRHNLLIANPLANEERLHEALAAADLTEFVAELPEGLETMVGERGLSLSGGQTQRLSIARAFLKDSPILILDEPTAHVDLASERAILASLEELSRGRAVLMISHRTATIAGADTVLRMSDGRITQ